MINHIYNKIFIYIYIFINKIKNKINKPIPENEFEEDCKIIEQYNFNNLCSQCKYKTECNNQFCKYNKTDKNKFLIIDDNIGIITSIKDVFEDLYSNNIIKKDKCELISYYTKQAPIFLIKNLIQNEIKIDLALIDITFGSIININGKNIKLNGIHIYYFLKKYNPNIIVRFYTGNVLNPYIKTYKTIKDFFYKITKTDMNNFVISKIEYKNDSLENEIIKMIKEFKDEK